MDIKSLFTFPILYKFYKNRDKENLLLECKWWEGLSKEDVGNYNIQLMTKPENKLGTYALLNIGKSYGKKAFDLTFIFLGYDGQKRIKDCTYKEFVEIYGDTVLHYLKGKELVEYDQRQR